MGKGGKDQRKRGEIKKNKKRVRQRREVGEMEDDEYVKF